MNQSVFPYFTIYPHKFKKIFQGSQALNFLKRLVSQTYNNSTPKGYTDSLSGAITLLEKIHYFTSQVSPVNKNSRKEE